MGPQQNIGAWQDGQPESRYRSYEGEPLSVSQPDLVSGLPFQEGRTEKVYQPVRDTTMLYRLLTMVFALAALAVFVYICLVLVGGTAGIISFCAASFTIMVIASTVISVKRDGEK